MLNALLVLYLTSQVWTEIHLTVQLYQGKLPPQESFSLLQDAAIPNLQVGLFL